jgi:phosphoglycolate phosphatase
MVKILTPQFDGQFCDQVTAKFREIYDSSSYPKSFLYEGVHQLLDRFSKKEYSFFVVTNKMKLATTRILSIFDIIQFFRDVITPDYSPLNKMNKTEMIRYVLSTYSLNKAATIMIGDSASDIVAARENDIMSIGFSGGFGNKSELSDSDPTFFASTYNDIEKIISK